MQRPPYFADWESKAAGLKSARCQIGDLLAIPHCLSQPSDSKATHRFTVTPAVMGIFTSALLSEVASNVISGTWTFLILTLCKNHSSPLSLLTAIAWLFSASVVLSIEPHGLHLLWSHESPAQGLDSFHWRHGRLRIRGCDFLKMPRVNMCQSQYLFFFCFCF